MGKFADIKVHKENKYFNEQSYEAIKCKACTTDMVIQRFHGGFTEKADPRPFLFYYNHCFFIFKISFTGSLNIDYWTVEHSCVEVSAEDSDTIDGCHADLPANGVARDLLTKTLSGLNVGDITFDGHTCYTQQTIPGKLAAKCFQ